MASLLIVDDHEIIRKGILNVIASNSNIQDIYECSNGTEAYRKLNEHVIDVVILDINMPGISGVETLRKILLKYPSQKVLMLSMHENLSIIHQVMNLGASGFICKSEFAENLNRAIDDILMGKVFLSDFITEKLQKKKHDKRTNLNVLTPREFEVLKLMSNGKNQNEIADLLNISSKTVANKIGIIKEKLEVNSDFELFYAAKENQLI